MIRFRIVLGFAVALLLAACAKEKKSVTQLAPVTPREARAIRNAIVYGHGVGPNEAPAAGASCADFVRQLKGFTAGALEVPEDWDHPESPAKIQVFYYWRKGTDEKRPPVVFFNGGPASDSHGSAELLATLPFTQGESFVFLDQRGTGCSTPFPADETDANALRLMKWGSRGIVGDAEAVRHHLFGDRKWRIYGQSYGGFIVHRYLELAPVGVDRAIAHGFSVMRDPVAWAAERVRSQHRVAGTYFAQYADDLGILEMARGSIPEKKCWQSGDQSVCGAAVLDSLTLMLGFQDDWNSLHQWIQSLRDADGKVSASALDSLVRTLVFGAYGEGGLAGDVISKMEILPGYDDRTGCAAALERLRADGEAPESWPINECRLLSAFEKPSFGLMKGVAAHPIDLDAIGANLTRGTESFYLFSGQQDVFVPFATFDEEVKRLGKLVHYESFPNSGHEGFYTERDVTDAVSAP